MNRRLTLITATNYQCYVDALPPDVAGQWPCPICGVHTKKVLGHYRCRRLVKTRKQYAEQAELGRFVGRWVCEAVL